jgi:hypothetical protein
MAAHPEYGVVLTYSYDESPQLYMCTVPKSLIAPLTERRLQMPLILDSEPDINDQFVKALALSALNLLALGQPGI